MLVLLRAMNLLQFYIFLAKVTAIISFDRNSHFNINDCLLDIMKRHFITLNTIVISINGEQVTNHKLIEPFSCKDEFSVEYETSIITFLYESAEYPLYIIRSSQILGKRISHVRLDCHIVISHYEEHFQIVKDLEMQVVTLTSRRLWNSHSRFIIIVSAFKNSSKELTEDIFEIFWKWDIVNLIVLFPTKREGENFMPINTITNSHVNETYTIIFDAYTWFPYNPVSQCGKVKQVTHLDQWILNDNDKGQFLYNLSLFPKKIPTHMNNCPLIVSTFQFEPMVLKNKIGDFDNGIELKLIKEFTARINMSLELLVQTDGTYWGIEMKNGSWNGMSGEVMNRISDVGMGNWYYRCHSIGSIECAYPHLIDEARWFIPCPQPYPRWASLTRVFNPFLWLVFLISFIFMAVVMFIIVNINDCISVTPSENQAYSSFAKCCLNFWAVILEESASNNPPRIFAIRTMFLTWVLYCWAMNTVYQTYFTSYLVDPGLQHKLSSEEEIFSSGTAYGIPSTMFPLFPGLNSERYEKCLICDDFNKCQDRVALKGNLALLFSRFNMDYVTASRYMDAAGKSLVCIFEEVYSNQLVSFPVKRGFLLLERLNHMSRHAIEAGLLEQWWNEIKHSSTLDSAKDFESSSEYIKLTLNHLQSAFYFLFIGLAFSIIIFLFEFLYQRM
ncbi:Ionotropic receptor 214 [Blattella germanica]|nr:Ionotropic receptor 214 [Blattella germanica]